jgi:nucleotide-binding universal stress UspA family protein
MTSFQRILAPTDFSPRCAWAARYAQNLAQRFSSELIFLHAGASGDPTALEAFSQRAVGEQDPACEARRIVAVRGDPAEVIPEFVRREKVDLIVMPTHAHGRFRRFLLGSVTAKVLDDVDCPVWTGVHQEQIPLYSGESFSSIVCATGLEPNAAAIIRWAMDLSVALHASCKVIHAIPAADETSDNPGEIELRKFLFRRAEERASTMLHKFGIEAEMCFAGGDVARVIREAVLRERAELVVLSRAHAERPLGRLRTQSYGIIRGSPCPVVSV